MDKQIEEMARAMCFQRESCAVTSCTKVNCETTWLAENLYNAGYRKASEVITEIDNALHDMAMEYHAAGHPEYFAVCEMVHHKVITPIEKKYTEGRKTNEI